MTGDLFHVDRNSAIAPRRRVVSDGPPGTVTFFSTESLRAYCEDLAEGIFEYLAQYLANLPSDNARRGQFDLMAKFHEPELLWRLRRRTFELLRSREPEDADGWLS